ncbi:complex 1 protein (LYR family) domain-containing protein [Purpureocillium lilacinum]|uniref:Complex 1 protein (LYR family) domain-containing protein n=1 Tax=Purpureocillium lilacinum TaxID=33203 RepID=A0A179GWQ4_PURLI|nr:complex 1 protein (LYR family) domain-containing protein [Purpureocillium lilacinum]
MRLSGLQKEVLALYRQCLRESRKKPQVRARGCTLKTLPGKTLTAGPSSQRTCPLTSVTLPPSSSSSARAVGSSTSTRPPASRMSGEAGDDGSPPPASWPKRAVMSTRQRRRPALTHAMAHRLALVGAG